MRKCDVHTLEQAAAYILDCNLATVSHMAMLKSKKKGEFKRQINIAQTSLDWAIAFNVDVSTTRASAIILHFSGSFEAWAAGYQLLTIKKENNVYI